MSDRRLDNLLQAFGVEVAGDLASVPVSRLTLDSRTVQAGDVFVALAGTQTDGAQFIDAAFARGAVAVLAEKAHSDARVLVVPQLRSQLSALASAVHGHVARGLTVYGITGTNGKTTTSQLLAAALQKLAGPTFVLGTLGYGLYGALHSGRHTTPDAITLQDWFADAAAQGVQQISMEVSSHGLDQGRVEAVPFRTAVFTNLTRDHLDYHGTMAAYGEAKRRLFVWPGLQHAILNADDAFGAALIADTHISAQKVAYSLRADVANELAVPCVTADRIHYSTDGILAEVNTPWGRRILQSPLLGEFNLSNLLAALAGLCANGYPLDQVIDALGCVLPIAGRMERFTGAGLPLVVIDYAHTPDALEKALMAVRLHTSGKVAVVFGCGGDRDKGKRPEMGRIAAQLADVVWLTNDNPRSEDPAQIAADIRAGVADCELAFVADRRQATLSALAGLNAGDALLLAGKGHENTLEIAGARLPYSDVEVIRSWVAARTGAAS